MYGTYGIVYAQTLCQVGGVDRTCLWDLVRGVAAEVHAVPVGRLGVQFQLQPFAFVQWCGAVYLAIEDIVPVHVFRAIGVDAGMPVVGISHGYVVARQLV